MAEPHREILRLDQAVAAASNGDNPPPAASVGVEVEQRPADDTTATPVSGVEISLHTGAPHLAEAPRDVARLEDVLKVEPKDRSVAPPDVRPADTVVEAAQDKTEQALVEPPGAPERHPVYVAAHVLREAFWFEQASAQKTAEAPSGEASEPESLIETKPDPPAADVPADEPPAVTQSVVRLLLGKASQGQLVAAFCLLTLIALVVVLTGRVPRRFVATN